MAKICPIDNSRVTYLACQDCDSKRECRLGEIKDNIERNPECNEETKSERSEERKPKYNEEERVQSKCQDFSCRA